MNTLVWVLAGMFLFNVALVMLFGFVLEHRRRRDLREIRELETLWRSPAVSVRAAGERSVSGVRVRGKHDVIVVHERKRLAMLRTTSYVLAVASVGAVMLAAILAPARPGPERPTSADGSIEGVFPEHGVDSRELANDPGGRSPRSDPDDEAEVAERMGVEVPAGANVWIPGDEESVAAVVIAKATSSTVIRLMWASVPNATGYVIKRWDEADPDDGGTWLTIGKTDAGTPTYTDRGLAAATTYYYRVSARLDGGVAPTSDVVSATTAIAPPAAPTLSAKARKSGIILEWTDVEGENGYRVERLAEGETEWVQIATTGQGVVGYKDGSLVSGASYRYRVVAVGSSGESPPSNVVELSAYSIDGAPPGQVDEEPPSIEPDESIDPAPDEGSIG